MLLSGAANVVQKRKGYLQNYGNAAFSCQSQLQDLCLWLPGLTAYLETKPGEMIS